MVFVSCSAGVAENSLIHHVGAIFSTSARVILDVRSGSPCGGLELQF